MPLCSEKSDFKDCDTSKNTMLYLPIICRQGGYSARGSFRFSVGSIDELDEDAVFNYDHDFRNVNSI